MALQMGCKCGQKIITEEASMGQTIRCPACNLLLRVPVIQHSIKPGTPGQAPATPPLGGMPPGNPNPIQSSSRISGLHPQVGQATPPSLQPPPTPQTGFTPQPGMPPVTPQMGGPGGYPQAPMPQGYQPPLPQEFLQAGAPPAPPTPVNEEEMPLIEEGQEDAEEEERFKEQQKKAKRRVRRQQLKMTSIGLFLVYWAIATLLVSIGLGCLMVVIMVVSIFIAAVSGMTMEARQALQGVGTVLSLFMLICWVLQFAYAVMHLVGSVFCCWIPPKSGARPLIITSVSLVGAVFLFMVIMIVMFVGAAITGSNALGVMASGLGIVFLVLIFLGMPAAFILFMLFLRALAFYLNQRSTGNEVINILITWISLIVVGFLVFLFAYLVVYVVPFVGPIIALAVVGGWYYYLVMQWIRLLNVVATLRLSLASEYGV